MVRDKFKVWDKLMIVSAVKEDFEAQEIGVGLIQSAIKLTELVIKNHPNFIIFVGSAGAYSELTPLLEIFYSSHAYNIEHSFIIGSAYTPMHNEIKSTFNGNKIGLSHKTTNSSNYITTREDMARHFINKNIELENMEFYSVLSVAKQFNIPALGIFCVTNYCNQYAHEQFRDNQRLSKTRLKEFLSEASQKESFI